MERGYYEGSFGEKKSLCEFMDGKVRLKERVMITLEERDTKGAAFILCCGWAVCVYFDEGVTEEERNNARR